MFSAAPVPGALTGVITESPDQLSVNVTVTLTGGSPQADSLVWTLPDGTRLSPGQTVSEYRALRPEVGRISSLEKKQHSQNCRLLVFLEVLLSYQILICCKVSY